MSEPAGFPTVALLLESLISEVRGLPSALADVLSKRAPEPKEAEPEGLWDAERVAAFLGCSKSWVYDNEAKGKLPSLHIGGMLRFDPKAIRALVQARAGPRGRVLPLKK